MENRKKKKTTPEREAEIERARVNSERLLALAEKGQAEIDRRKQSGQ